jgi:crotonobetainyl-CoA:carnitine CoA-transferase CaiB-like acyl-CoA transferase
MDTPLADVTVIDCGQIIAGPLCACFLADLGADVIKVEPPDGELFRPDDAEDVEVDLAEYDSARTIDGEPFSPSFELYNRNKRALSIDLKTDRGQDVMQDLLADADVFVQNWPPGVADRLGLGWAELHDLNPDLVYAHITGYGETGPLAEYPGMDTIAQHISGFSSMLGYEDDRPPIRSQSSLADYFAAFSALSSALAALYHREVHDAGGQKIDVSLLEALVHHLDGAFEIYNNQGEVPGKGGRNAYSSPDMLYGAAEAADGWVCVALLLFSDGVWEAYCDLLDRPDLREREKYRHRAGRMDDAALLSALFEEWLEERTVEEAVDRLNDAGIPAARHNTVGEAAELDHMDAREAFRTVEHPTFQELTLTASPLSLSETGVVEPAAAPELGRDTEAVLREAGYDDGEIEKLREKGVV